MGNQRRLKYAPLPDLTSTAPKPFATSEKNFPTSQQAIGQSAPEYFTPSTIVPSLGSSQSLSDSQSFTSGFPPPSSSTIQQTPFYIPARDPPSSVPFRATPSQYNPGIVNPSNSSQTSISSPREIPLRFPETATPQNTPANASYTGFAASYAASNAESLITKDHVEPRVSTSSVGPTKFPEGLTFDIPSSAYSRNNVLPSDGCIIEPTVSAATNDAQAVVSGPTEDSSFTLKSAAKVTAKLEHLLAEREEDSVVSEPSTPLGHSEDSNTAECTKQSIPWSNEAHKEIAKSEGSEDLAEIDLTTNDSVSQLSSTQDSISAPPIPSGLHFPPTLVSESFAITGSHSIAAPEIPSKSSPGTDTFSQNPVPQVPSSVPNFFSNIDTEPKKSEFNYFSTTTESSVGFHHPQVLLQPRQSPSSFFNPTPRTIESDAPLEFSNAPAQHDPPTSEPQFIPTLYNPNDFLTVTQDAPFSGFSSQFPPAVGIPTQNPFSSVLSSSPPNFPSSFMGTAMPEPTGSATLNPVQTSVGPGIGRSNTATVPPSLQSLVSHTFDSFFLPH